MHHHNALWSVRPSRSRLRGFFHGRFRIPANCFSLFDFQIVTLQANKLQFRDHRGADLLFELQRDGLGLSFRDLFRCLLQIRRGDVFGASEDCSQVSTEKSQIQPIVLCLVRGKQVV